MQDGNLMSGDGNNNDASFAWKTVSGRVSWNGSDEKNTDAAVSYNRM